MKLIVSATHKNHHSVDDLIFLVGEDNHKEIEIFKLCEDLLSLVIKSKIKEIHFEVHPVFALVLFHDLLNLNLKISFDQKHPRLENEKFFSGNLVHLLTEHALDYFENLNDFATEDLADNFIVIHKEKVIEKHNMKARILKSSDALIYTQQGSTLHYPVSTHKRQDLSYLLYRPPLKFISPFFIRKSFYDSLSKQQRNELHQNPNHFFFQNEVTISSTLLKTPGEKTYSRDCSYFDNTLSLYESVL